MTVEFTLYPKTPRLYREVFITEKIDGTNAGIQVVEARAAVGDVDGLTVGDYTVFAQSRKRLITPRDDNFGFARWVYDNAQFLATTLGAGVHFGEWWGSGIQRGYGQTRKFFSLFNVGRWDRYEGKTPLPKEAQEIGLGTVPVLYRGRFSTAAVDGALTLLRDTGSQATWEADDTPFRPAEGIIVYHAAAGQAFKVLLENDDISKTEAAGR